MIYSVRIYLILITYIVVYRVYRSLIEFLSFDNAKIRIILIKVKSVSRYCRINRGNAQTIFKCVTWRNNYNIYDKSGGKNSGSRYY